MSDNGKATASASSGGIGTLGLLGVVFVTLRLLGVIDWSWWWVTAPFWGGLALVLGILAVIAIVAGLVLGVAWTMDLIAARRPGKAKKRARP